MNHRDHVLNRDLQSTPEGSLSLNEPISAIGRSPVWLVLFDPLPEIPAVSPVSSAESQAQAAGPAAVFECLESRSVVFEQYLIQDVRESATLDDYLGGADAVGNWGRCLAGAGVGAVWLQLGRGADQLSTPAAAFSAPALTAALRPEIFSWPTELPAMFPERLNLAVAQAQLVLVTVRLGAEPSVSAGGDASKTSAVDVVRAANCLLAQLEQLAAEACASSAAPVWLVTGFRGLSRDLERPFESGADESLLHVPLWWTEALSAGTRLQALCGSFDLLPTVAELLQCEGRAVETGGDEAERSHSGAFSLQSPDLQGTSGAERLLRIRHDAWRGLRTSQYFLLQPLGTAAEADAGEGESAGQRLYLKPEDYWNVNDCIVSCGEIAREMSDGV